MSDWKDYRPRKLKTPNELSHFFSADNAPPLLSEELLERSKQLTRPEHLVSSQTSPPPLPTDRQPRPSTSRLQDRGLSGSSSSRRVPADPPLFDQKYPLSEDEEALVDTSRDADIPRCRPLLYGFVPDDVIARLCDHANWRLRAEAIEELQLLVSKLPTGKSTGTSLGHPSPSKTDLQAVLRFLITVVDDVNFKVGLTALNIVTELLSHYMAAAGTNAGTGSCVVSALLECLAQRLGDSKIVIRQAHMMLLMRLMEVAGAGRVIHGILALALPSRQWRVREEAVNVATAGLLRFPRAAVNLEVCAAELAPTLLDCKQRVRQAAMEAMAVLAHALGDGNMQPLVAIVTDLERRSVAPELLNAVLARTGRRQMPHLSADGLVSHSLQVATSSAAAARLRGTGADIDWILAATSPSSASRPPSSDLSGSSTSASLSSNLFRNNPDGAAAAVATVLSGGHGNGHVDITRPLATPQSVAPLTVVTAAVAATADAAGHVPRPRFSSAGRKQLPWELPPHSSSDAPSSALGGKRAQNAHSAPTYFDRESTTDAQARPTVKPPMKTRVSWAASGDNTTGTPSPFQSRGGGTGGSGSSQPPLQRRATIDLSSLDERLPSASQDRQPQQDDDNSSDVSSYLPVRTRPSQLQLLEAQAMRRAQEQELHALGGLGVLDPVPPAELPKPNWGVGEKPQSGRRPPQAPTASQHNAVASTAGSESSTTTTTTAAKKKKSGAKPVKAQRSFGGTSAYKDPSSGGGGVVGSGGGTRTSSNANRASTTNRLHDPLDLNTFSSAPPPAAAAAAMPMSSSSSGYGSATSSLASSEASGYLSVADMPSADRPPTRAIPPDWGKATAGGTTDDAPRTVTRLGLSPSLRATVARRKMQDENRRLRNLKPLEDSSDGAYLETITWPEDTSSCTSLSSTYSELGGQDSPTSLLDEFDAPSTRPPRPPTGRSNDVPSAPSVKRTMTSTAPTAKTPTRQANQLSLSMPSPRALQSVQRSTSVSGDSGAADGAYDIAPLAHPSGAISNAVTWMAGGEDWELVCTGLNTVRSLATFHVDVLTPQLHTILLSVVHEVKNLRSKVASLAIKTLEELYLSLKKQMDLDLDLTVRSLLGRCGDSSGFVKEEASSAIMAMVSSVTPSKAASVICNIGRSNRSIHVRKVASLALENLVSRLGADRALHSRELMDMLLPTFVHFSTDASPDARYHARKSVAMLMEVNDFRAAAGPSLKPAESKKLDDVIAHIKNKGVGELSGSGRQARRVSGTFGRQHSTSSTSSTDSSPMSNRSYNASFGTPTSLSRTNSVNSTDSPTATILTAPVSRMLRQASTELPAGSGPLPTAIISGLTSTDGRARDSAITSLSDLANQRPGTIVHHAVKVFDAFIPRFYDANSKIALHAVACQSELFAMQSLAEVWPKVAKTLVPAIFSALTSRHCHIRTEATNALQLATAVIDGMILLPVVCNVAQYGNKGVKSYGIDTAACAFDVSFPEHPRASCRTVLPVVWHSTSLLVGKVTKPNATIAPVSPALRMAIIKLVHIVYDRIEDNLFTQAKQQLTPEEMEALQNTLQAPPI